MVWGKRLVLHGGDIRNAFLSASHGALFYSITTIYAVGADVGR